MFPDLGMCQSAMMVRTSVSALEYEPAASARGVYGLLAKDVPSAHRDPAFPRSLTPHNRGKAVARQSDCRRD